MVVYVVSSVLGDKTGFGIDETFGFNQQWKARRKYIELIFFLISIKIYMVKKFK